MIHIFDCSPVKCNRSLRQWADSRLAPDWMAWFGLCAGHVKERRVTGFQATAKFKNFQGRPQCCRIGSVAGAQDGPQSSAEIDQAAGNGKLSCRTRRIADSGIIICPFVWFNDTPGLIPTCGARVSVRCVFRTIHPTETHRLASSSFNSSASFQPLAQQESSHST